MIDHCFETVAVRKREVVMRRVLKMVKQAASDFVEDDALTLAGALAFYAALSLAPLVVLLLTASAFLGEGTSERVIAEAESMIGPEAGQGLRLVIDSAQQQKDMASLAGLISLGLLLVSATGVFAQLQYSLNRIWHVRVRSGSGVWAWLRKRLLSLGMILAIAFLLLVSLVLDTALRLVLPDSGRIWQAVSLGVSLLVFTMLFALMFKYLPDVEIRWKSVWVGAVATAVLFALGKFLISLYLGRSTVASSYGAAGSLVVLLLWVYYSALILFFGAELTRAYARHFGERIQPAEHAEWLPRVDQDRKQGD
jgi:membrane protein